MSTRLREIPIERTIRLAWFRDLDHMEPTLEHLLRLGHEVADQLATGQVWMLNSTRLGGGVAETLPRLCSLLAEVGIHARWLVLEPDDPAFFQATRNLHDLLHGEPGLDDPEGAATIYDRTCAEAAEGLRMLGPDDVLVVHDPQPAGVAMHLKGALPRLLWRCHVGVPERNEHTAAGWAFLRPWLQPYERMFFSSSAYIPQAWRDRSAVIHPGIDPLSHKNRALRPYKLVGVLRSAGLIDGPEVPEWARFCAPVERFVDGAFRALPIPDLLHRPIILQVSRFDRLKGFQWLIPAFVDLVGGCHGKARHVRADPARLLAELEAAQLVLAGPDPGGVADDPAAASALEELTRQQAALPAELRARVHVLRLPMESAKENALIVNALQRLATVVVQNSLHEGFGLTVAEALWKGTPVVASNVGGIAVQVRHRTDGLLLDDPADTQALAELLLHCLACPLDAEAMARSGRRRVREHFLVLSEVRRWLEELQFLLSMQRSGGLPGGASHPGAFAESAAPPG